MGYRVVIESQVSKYIKKLGNTQRSYFKRRFKKLEEETKGYRLLDTHRNIQLWELRSLSHRVYYTVEQGVVVITNIEYDGDIDVARAGNKNSQKKDIDFMKKKIRNSKK